MKPINIQIPGMQSSHCMQRVKYAIDQINGVQIQELTKGSVKIILESDILKSKVIQSIEEAGYSTSIDTDTEKAECHSACCLVNP